MRIACGLSSGRGLRNDTPVICPAVQRRAPLCSLCSYVRNPNFSMACCARGRAARAPCAGASLTPRGQSGTLFIFSFFLQQANLKGNIFIFALAAAP